MDISALLNKPIGELTEEEFLELINRDVSNDGNNKESFNPVSDEWKEVHWGATPLGGDLSIAYFYDKNGERCKKSEKAYMDIVIYTKEGVVVNSVMGHNPYR